MPIKYYRIGCDPSRWVFGDLKHSWEPIDNPPLSRHCVTKLRVKTVDMLRKEKKTDRDW